MSEPKLKTETIMNLNDLRIILMEEIQKVINGKSAPAVVNSITNATGKIFYSVKLEMEYAKMVGKKPNVKMIESVK